MPRQQFLWYAKRVLLSLKRLKPYSITSTNTKIRILYQISKISEFIFSYCYILIPLDFSISFISLPGFTIVTFEQTFSGISFSFPETSGVGGANSN